MNKRAGTGPFSCGHEINSSEALKITFLSRLSSSPSYFSREFQECPFIFLFPDLPSWSMSSLPTPFTI